MHFLHVARALTLVSFLALSACDSSESPTDAGDGDQEQPPVELAQDNSRKNSVGEDNTAARVEQSALALLERRARTHSLKGDLDAILERGYIRVLVPHSKTFFFHEGARPRGLAYDFMEAFAKQLRKRHGGRLLVIYLPVSRDRLIPGIADGLGDVAIAGLSATPERKSVVDFVTHASFPVAEVVVTGPGAPALESLEDLAGQRIFIRASSSYHESLQDLNARLRAAGKREVNIVRADENLEVEDILELIRSGVEQITVADDYLATFWADVMGGLTVREDLVVSEVFPLGPAVRKNSPQLVAELGAFQKTHGLGTLFGNVVFKRYFKDNPWARNPNTSVDRKRFERAVPLFRKYGAKYRFDELLLMAQGYQESRLKQSSRSRSGAIGIMQIKPSTAAGRPVNIPDIKKMENNIHAGVKYLRHLADDYFQDPAITALNRHLFAIAAYNGGPTRIQSLRRQAEAQGLDPNVWFNNVEIISAQTLGRENVEYVRNVLKYWVAFRLAADLEEPTVQDALAAGM